MFTVIFTKIFVSAFFSLLIKRCIYIYKRFYKSRIFLSFVSSKELTQLWKKIFMHIHLVIFKTNLGLNLEFWVSLFLFTDAMS